MLRGFAEDLKHEFRGYNSAALMKDLMAGLTVTAVALPLALAFGVSSGADAASGLITAIIAGLLAGGYYQISGPTGAMAAILTSLVAGYGLDGVFIATLLAGILLLLAGILRLGKLTSFIPAPVITGFTSGIAVTIVIGQLKDFFGVTYPEGMPTIETMEKLKAFLAGIHTFNTDSLIVGLVCLAILIIAPRFTEKIPGSLLAVIGGILMVQLLPLQVNTIGDLYTISNKLPSFHMPQLSFEMIQTALPDAFTIAILAAIESLLSCVVADGMINGKHRSNMELAAQGAGNIASALFGGIPATGAIARTAANVKNGGRTPVAGMIHAVVLVLILIILMPYAAMIPMPAIAAILFMVAYNMCQWRTFTELVKTAPKSDIAVLILTFLLTIVFDLVIAIEIGLLVAVLLFMKRMSDVTEVHSWKYAEDEEEAEREKLRKLSPHINVYEISGPLFFGAADVIGRIAVKDHAKCLILRMRSVPALDSTALNAMTDLYKNCEKRGITLILSHVNQQPMKVMEKAGFAQKVGQENFCENIDRAIKRAEELVH